MSLTELIKYYADLLILQYKSQPNAYATIQALVKMVLMDKVPWDVMNAFEVDSASGVHLDLIGKYVGASRSGQGVSGPVVLSDDDFLKLIKLSIIKNNSGSSLFEIQYLLSIYFPEKIFMVDNGNMTIQYYVMSSIGSADLIQVIVNGGYLPTPMACLTTVTISPPLDQNYFGFRTYIDAGIHISPFNTYPFYQLTYPWGNYSNLSV